MSGANLYYPWADIAADAGLVVKVTDTNAGWERRARSSGGFPTAPLGVMWHHAASSNNTSDEACVNYQVRGNPDNPVGNMTIGRNGDVWPIAGGASNCSGKGGPMTFSRGTCAKDSGNTALVNVEVNNDGVGGAWSVKCVDSYFALSNAVNAYLDNLPTDITSHALGDGSGYTDRKIDPATANAVQGPWRPRSVNSSGTWSLPDMRAECQRRAGAPPQEDDMTDEQAAQLNSLYLSLTQSIDPNQVVDPGGAPLNVPWAVAWSWMYLTGSIDQKLTEIIHRLDTLEGERS